MTWYVIVIHLLLAIILFYLVNWIGAKSRPLDFGYVQMSVGLQDDTAPLFNYFFKVLAPVIFMILVAALFQWLGLEQLNTKLYWLVIDYWLFRLFYIAVKGQLPLLNWPLQIIYWISSIGLSIWVYSIIDSLDSLFPDPASLLEELWILIILFLYSIFNKLDYSRRGAERRIKNYTKQKFFAFKEKYGGIIDDAFSIDEFKAIVYSLMIYEDFNRPAAARALERFLFHFSNKEHTYGVMQMKSNRPLSDEESVRLAIKKIKEDAKENLKEQVYEEVISINGLKYIIINRYNPGDYEYTNHVEQVFDNLVALFYKDARTFIPYQEVLADLA